MAYILKFIYFKSSKNKTPLLLPINELRQTEISIMKCIHETEFSDEIKRLKDGRTVMAVSKILELDPYLDTNGVLRVGCKTRFGPIRQNIKLFCQRGIW